MHSLKTIIAMAEHGARYGAPERSFSPRWHEHQNGPEQSFSAAWHADQARAVTAQAIGNLLAERQLPESEEGVQ